MMPIALVRCSAGQLSLTSAAPDAHSPPMPSPSRARQMSSCTSVCDVAAPSEQSEKIRIVNINVRARPKRSAMNPKNRPPAAETSSVMVPSRPAVASSNWKYSFRRPIIIT